jgi:hydroxyisourate hydrolase
MSHLTTHILDTAIGRPAEGVPVVLQHKLSEGNWDHLAEGITNHDGRVLDLLPEKTILEVGVYRLIFNTDAYFHKHKVSSFYPKVLVEFTINDSSHYHVPLLLSPFGYSTYRGS